jgi:hypothetical protein
MVAVCIFIGGGNLVLCKMFIFFQKKFEKAPSNE